MTNSSLYVTTVLIARFYCHFPGLIITVNKVVCTIFLMFFIPNDGIMFYYTVSNVVAVHLKDVFIHQYITASTSIVIHCYL